MRALGCELVRYLQAHRKVAGLSQQALAVKAGMSIRQVMYLEAGTKEPKLSTAQALADALGLTLAELLAPPKRTLAELLAPPKRNRRKRRSA
jgi:transcriptional regulator with XRE-family HTH domain